MQSIQTPGIFKFMIDSATKNNNIVNRKVKQNKGQHKYSLSRTYNFLFDNYYCQFSSVICLLKYC